MNPAIKLTAMFEAAEVQPVPFGHSVFREGEAGEVFYRVRSGRLRVLKKDADGQARTVGFLFPGDCFGEGALLTGRGHRATVRAAEHSEVAIVAREVFEKALGRSRDLRKYIEDRVAHIAHRDFTRFLKGEVPDEAMQGLFARLRRKNVEAGEEVGREGVDGSAFYVIGSGEMEAVGRAGNVVALGAGDYFGDQALLESIREPFTVRAKSACALYFLPESDFDKSIIDVPGLRQALEAGRKLAARLVQDAKPDDETDQPDSGFHAHRGKNGIRISDNPASLRRSASRLPIGPQKDADHEACHRDAHGLKGEIAAQAIQFAVSEGEREGEKPGRTWSFPFLKQHDQSDCGAACLGMICKYYGMPIGLNRLRDMANVSRNGTSLAALAEAAETLGFSTRGVRTGYEALMRTDLPAILHWEGNHFVVLYKIDKRHVKIADPGLGIRKLSRAEFEKGWTNMALLLDYTERVSENEPSRSSFRRFLPLVRPYAGILIEVLLASVILSLFGLASPIFIQTIVDQVLVHHDRDLLNLMLVGMVVVTLFQMATGTLRTYLIGYVSARLSIGMLSRFYRHLLSLPMRFFALRRTGDLTTRFRENAAIQRLLTGTAVSAVLDVVMLFVYLGLMVYYNVELTLVMLIFVPLSVGLTLVYTPVLKAFSQRAFLARAEQSSVLIDSLRGIDVVKAKAVERTTRWQWEGRFTKEIQIGFQQMKMQMAFGTAGNMIHLLSNTVILWYGATLVMEGRLSVGQLMAFNALIGNVMGPIMGLIGLWPQVQEARIALDRLNDIYDTPMETSRQGRSGLVLKNAQGRIAFEEVFFRYGAGSDEPYVLNDIRLTAEPGQRVAIVGRSGAGKTTLVKLIPRLFDPTEGRVTLDGMDVRDFDPGWLRRQVGMVLQEPFLFGGTIAENIAVGQEDVDMDRVLEVARLACVQDFVRDMPLGYETRVGEQGIGLSGGQKQRIAIARALYGDPKILIFDEATNALDTESEQAIQANLDVFLKDRTAFVIAHRLRTVRDADVIVVMDQGHVVEAGDHGALMAKQGVYYHMCSQQLQVV